MLSECIAAYYLRTASHVTITRWNFHWRSWDHLVVRTRDEDFDPIVLENQVDVPSPEVPEVPEEDLVDRLWKRRRRHGPSSPAPVAPGPQQPPNDGGADEGFLFDDDAEEQFVMEDCRDLSQKGAMR